MGFSVSPAQPEAVVLVSEEADRYIVQLYLDPCYLFYCHTGVFSAFQLGFSLEPLLRFLTLGSVVLLEVFLSTCM